MLNFFRGLGPVSDFDDARLAIAKFFYCVFATVLKDVRKLQCCSSYSQLAAQWKMHLETKQGKETGTKDKIQD